MFEKGEYIVYGNRGICEVKDITVLDLDETSKDSNAVNGSELSIALNVPREKIEQYITQHIE